MNKPHLLLFLTAVLITAIPSSGLRAAQEASIQLAVATPDPIRAGETVTFQIIYVNSSAVPWTEGEYSVAVEIFSPDETFIRRTALQAIRDDVQPGASALLLITERVPDDHWGQYLFRVSLISKGRVVHLSSLYPFHVTASAPRAEPETAEMLPDDLRAFSGSAVLSSRIDRISPVSDGEPVSGHNSSLSVNALGSFGFGAVVFNSTVYSTDEDFLDVYNIYLNISGSRGSLEMGDSMPNFSNLTLRGQSGRGVYYNHRPGPYDVKVAVLQSAEKDAGDDFFSGSYSRYILGASASRDIMRDLNIGVSAVRAFDDLKSISTSAALGIPAETSDVISVFAGYHPGDFSFKAETGVNMLSRRGEDFENESGLSMASRIDAAYNKNRIYASGAFYLIEPSFISLGAPGVLDDRIGYETSFSYRPLQWLTAGYTRRAYNDNIKGLPETEMTTTAQKMDYGTLGILRPGLPFLHLSGSRNTVTSDPAGSLENESLTGSASLSYSYSGHFVSAGLSLSGFRDKVGSAPDLNTVSSGINYSGAVTRRLTLNGGYSASSTSNVADNSKNTSGTISAGATIRVIPGRLTLVYSGSLTERSGLLYTEQVDTSETRGAIEMTWRLHDSYSVTLGGILTGYKDREDSINDYNGVDFLLRGLYSF